MIKIIKDKLHWVLIIFAALYTFWYLPYTFYQQDEWQTLGHNIVLGLSPLLSINPLYLFFDEVRPLGAVLYIILLGFFKFTVVPSVILAIILHIANGFLTYYLVIKLTKQRMIALVASLFLITNSVAHQTVTWVSAVGTLPAITFILAALICYFKYIEKSNKKFLFLSFIFTIISIYFKGIGLFLFLLFPLMSIIYADKSVNLKFVNKILKDNLPLLIFGFLLILVRFSHLFFKSEQVAGFSAGGNSSFLQIIGLRSILYPLTSLFQSFIPARDIYTFTPSITKMQYKFLADSPLVDLVAQSIVADMVAILGSILIFCVLGLIVFKSKDKIITRNIVFALILFLAVFLPYAVYDRDSSYLSSRYFYLGLVPAGILLGYIVSYFYNLNKYLKWVVIIIMGVFFMHHSNVARSDILYQVKLGNERKAVLNGIKSLQPKLNDKTIFYVTSDKQYYGPITNPFQNGLGYVLEVWYYDSGKIPKEFLEENFLWDLGAEGYRESNGKGFGYYQDIDKMVLDMKKNKLNVSLIRAFSLSSSEGKILDITPTVVSRVSTISGILK
ncbi:hypothetical protein HZA75_06335 [Candidatus Roizmanbacteria bacterium]|nr:hypothetical protein [Candidatus Roizmanbacteria bacterium]